ncbi:MAG: hypothetical protein HQ565_04355, partial [Bacteroidetes bacterium]|nr:hypothetical protein [Bacteroidota bacterium]
MTKHNKKKRSRGRKNLLRDNILSLFIADPLRLFNYKQISSRLAIKDKAGRDLVGTILAELLTEESIVE